MSFSTEASCITEMSVLMACWKQNNFVDTLCSNEINSFYMCVEKAQVCPCSAPSHKHEIIFFLIKIQLMQNSVKHAHALTVTLAVQKN